LPERKAAGRDAFQTDPRQLKQWIAALPLANASATARQLYHAVRAINQQRMDPADRLASLEALRRPLSQVADTVDRQIVGSTFPLPPTKAQLGTIARDFQSEMAVGYRIALVDLTAPEGRVPFLRGKQVALAAVRAIAHLGAQMSKAYLLYATPPEGLWQQLHDLFRFAQLLQVDAKTVEDPELGGADVSPRSSYQHALLLAISNPYRLAQKDIHEAHMVTRVWAPMCALRVGASSEHAYSIPVDEDRGPGYLPEERTSAAGALLSFDTSALEAELERQMNLVHGVSGPIGFRLKGSAAVSVEPTLIRRIMQSWAPLANRNHARLPAGHMLDTLVGLHAIHYYLAGQVDFEAFVRRACGPAIHLADKDRAASWIGQALDSGKPECFRARVLDQSLGGYRIEWEQGESVRARVGEIVAVAPVDDEDEDRDWMVGMVRWLRLAPTGRVDAGIELLARQARAAVLRALDGQGRPKPPVRAIRLEAAHHGTINGNEPQFSVVAPSVLERGALRYELAVAPDRWADSDEAETLELPGIAVLEQTGTYVRIAPREAGANGNGQGARSAA
jgi:hypothetical protein